MLKWGIDLTVRAPTRTVPGELALIKTIRGQANRAGRGIGALRLGIGDDCAVLRPRAGFEICVTTDFSLEGRHFLRELHAPESAGHRCLARGLSDLAAMGAEPLAVFLSLAVPSELPARWIERFLSGLLALARKHRIPLAGGDTAESPVPEGARGGLIVADIVAVGQVPRGKAVQRSGARPGDALYVTGGLGGAAGELLAAREQPERFRSPTRAAPGHPHFYPEPRLAVGYRLRALAHAMIDISDGLSTDLTHLCRESGVAAAIEEAALPIDPRTALLSWRPREPVDMALHGGEDYELLFAAAGTGVPRRIAGVPIHRIGTLRRARRGEPLIVVRDPEGKRIRVEPRGFEHFRQGARGNDQI